MRRSNKHLKVSSLYLFAKSQYLSDAVEETKPPQDSAQDEKPAQNTQDAAEAPQEAEEIAEEPKIVNITMVDLNKRKLNLKVSVSICSLI